MSLPVALRKQRKPLQCQHRGIDTALHLGCTQSDRTAADAAQPIEDGDATALHLHVLVATKQKEPDSCTYVNCHLAVDSSMSPDTYTQLPPQSLSQLRADDRGNPDMTVAIAASPFVSLGTRWHEQTNNCTGSRSIVSVAL